MHKLVYKLLELGCTARHIEVALLLMQGLSNKEISAKLFITVSAVQARKTSLYRSIGIKTTPGHQFGSQAILKLAEIEVS